MGYVIHIYTVGWHAENNVQISQSILARLVLNWVPISIQTSAHIGLTKMEPKIVIFRKILSLER